MPRQQLLATATKKARPAKLHLSHLLLFEAPNNVRMADTTLMLVLKNDSPLLMSDIMSPL